MNAYYEQGATHNDHHREMNIQVVGAISADAVDKIIAGFMSEDAQTAEPCTAEAVDDFTASAQPTPPPAEGGGPLPGELSSRKALNLLRELQEIGMLDEDFQPVRLSWAERGYLAQQIAYKLGLEHQWKTFAELWHCDAASLRSGYNRAKDMPKMAVFDEKIKDIIS